MAESPIDLTLERLARLGSLVKQRFDAIEQTIRARTEDATRMSDIEQRLRTLEERQPRT